MKILAVAEQRDQKFKKSACEVVSTAHVVGKQIGADVVALVMGSGIDAMAAELGAYGAGRVIVVDDPVLANNSNMAFAKVIAEVARMEAAEIVLLVASQTGKDIAPRVAVKLDAGLASDCIALTAANGTLTATRAIYAGKAMIDVQIKTPTKVFTLRPNVFPAVSGGGSAVVERKSVSLGDEDLRSVVTSVAVSSGRPDVTEADIVVSGGRGIKGPEHFHLIEKLADVLGAGVGASRAVVDAGWRPHDEQVGQTGKTVSPTLYVACGISGAVQHIAGMSSSKCIVAINKDKDAPIFQIADYGIVGDLFDVVPALIEHLKSVLGK
jgi:electron transfer flavoprotein alpha subunit